MPFASRGGDYPRPFDEAYRQSVLDACGLVDQPPDPDLERVARLAARRFNAPMALVSLLDGGRQWFPAQVGMAARETPRDWAFCAHAVVLSAPLVVADAQADPRFADSPLVTGAPYLRFYAGVPLVVEEARLGTLCILDTVPRPALRAEELADLEDFAALASSLLTARRASGDGLQAQEAEQARERSRALALLSHELRTPLNALLGFADIIADEALGPVSPPAYRDYAVHLRDGGRRLERLADRALRYTQIALGRVELDEEAVGAAEIVARACGLIAAQARHAGVTLVVPDPPCAAEGLTITADAALLEQALFQLLRNALEHGCERTDGEPCRITVTLACPDGCPRFTVRDEGPGLSPQEWSALVKPLAVAGDLMQRGCEESLGLGLALAKRLLELHGGRLELDEAGPGAGAAVSLILPRWRRLGAAGAETAAG